MIMKKKCLFGLCLWTAALFSTAAYPEEKWNEHRSQHFLIYYKAVPDDFVLAVESQAEQSFEEITDHLGFRRLSLWSFDDRAKIYIYDDQKDYLENARQFQWSHGAANTRKKIPCRWPSSGNPAMPGARAPSRFRTRGESRGGRDSALRTAGSAAAPLPSGRWPGGGSTRRPGGWPRPSRSGPGTPARR